MPKQLPIVGILGGGQLGKMLALAAHNWELPVYMLDQSPDFPGGNVSTKFVVGDFKNYDDVMSFGQQVDILTVEIEHVNTEALHTLKRQGKIIHPDPAVLDTIKDKGLQKQFYQRHRLPTAPFELYESKEAVLKAIADGQLSFPFVQKTRTAGYDGKGVAVIKNKKQLDQLLPGGCLIEPLVPIDKEIAVVVARNPSGKVVAFDPVEMDFHPTANLVDYLFCPARISKKQAKEVTAIAKKIIKKYQVCGLLAVEFFLTKSGEWLINEVAPRPHNSGHHTIDSCITSQYQQHLRAILDWPLGDPQILSPAVMINLLGHPDYNGPVRYQGWEACLAIKGCHLHIYGKTVTKPYRKMGHATIVDHTIAAALRKAKKVKKTLIIKT